MILRLSLTDYLNRPKAIFDSPYSSYIQNEKWNRSGKKQQVKLMLGDNIITLKGIPSNSIDSIVTDPPYGINFMGKNWDYDVPSKDFWLEIKRVLKPGGHVLSFCGTRTYHRMVVNIEDAGFEIRDCISWLYGSGFPKSHNVGLSIDKKNGQPDRGHRIAVASRNHPDGTLEPNGELLEKYVAKTLEGKLYEGWGTALKPAQEIICVARKPLSEPTVAANVLKWGTGGINIDGCRIGFDMNDTNPATNPLYRHQNKDKYRQVTDNGQSTGKNVAFTNSLNPPSIEGRFPANIIFECTCDNVIKGVKKEPFSYKGKEYKNKETSMFNGDKPEAPSNYNDTADIHTNPLCPCYILDKQSGERKVGKGKRSGGFQKGYINSEVVNRVENEGYNYSGGASRFFYVAKVSKKERNIGLDGFEGKRVRDSRDAFIDNPFQRGETPKKNNHPTVKPINLLIHLVRLVTPVYGIVLDPYMGSGSVGISTRLEGFRFLGLEQDPDYFKIAKKRIAEFEQYRSLIK